VSVWGENLKIEIQGYWKADMKSADHAPTMTPEKYLKEHGSYIDVADVIIDGDIKGTVAWDGVVLFVHFPRQEPIRVVQHRSLEQQIRELWESRGDRSVIALLITAENVTVANLDVLKEEVESVDKETFKRIITAKRM